VSLWLMNGTTMTAQVDIGIASLEWQIAP